ncbi:MAG: hypothetical protein RI996_147, partial [Candidatus Parcubacteria bacterium]
EMDWAPHMTSEQVQSIVESTEELRIRVNTIQAIFPESTAFQALFITSAIYDTFDTSIEAIKSMPLLGTHLEVNPRMAPRLISKIVEFDQTALEGLHRLHKIDSSKNAMGDISQSEGWKNTVMHDKLSSVLGLTQSRKNSYYEEPIGNGESEIPPLDLLASENRKINIKNLREYKNNPKILTAIETAGILSNDWLYYESETSFTISTGAEIELATNYIQSPLTRLIEENITTLATTFKEGFYNSIPSDMEVSHEFDDKQQELLQKLTTLQEAYHSSDDEKKKIGMQKGIASIEKMLREYKSPKMRDAINGMLGSITVQATRIVELRKEQALAQAETGARNIEYIQRIKRIDQSILDQTKSLILRLKKAKTYIESIAEQMKISYDIFETKELFEHIQEDSQAIMSTLETLESGENTALVGREMTIGICNRNPYSSLYLGNYTGCCVSIEGEIHGAESPIIDYLTDLGMQIVTVVDTTKREKPVPIAAIWTYIGEMDGEPVMQIDNIETNTGYTDAHREQFTAEVQKYMEDYAQKLGLRLYQGTSYNDLVVAEFGHTNKLGGLYNRPDGYYLEAEEDEE